MVDVFLVRHAIAEPRDHVRWPDDCLRPLSQDGAELFRQAARGVEALGIQVDAVLTSSCVRAAQTAQILTEEAGWPDAESCDALEPLAPASALCCTCSRREPRHRSPSSGISPSWPSSPPSCSRATERAVALELKKGSVTCIRFAGRPARDAGVLLWSLSPKILRRLGR